MTRKRNITASRIMVITCLVVAMICFINNPAKAQSTHTSPWAPTELNDIPPVASIETGVWLKGDLHLHSAHSNDATNNSVGKIIAFAQSVGMAYICITDHDNHVHGDVAAAA